MIKSSPSPALTRRLRDGLERIACVLRADRWGATETTALNPTQAQILDFLAGRGDKGARVGAVAAHLGVSQPTATDSIASLEKKGLAARRPDPQDRRALAVAPTEAGRALAQQIDASPSAAERALQSLDARDQTELLGLLVKLIRNLQIDGAVAPQRLCVTCRYFRPHAHADPAAPHHCDFVDAAFGPQALRLDCGDHIPAPPAEAEKIWSVYTGTAAASPGGGGAAVP